MRSETIFQREAELVKHFTENYAKKFLNKVEGKAIRRFVLVEQLDCYTGVADIVLATLRPYARPNKRRQPLNRNWLLPLTRLSKNEVIELAEYAEKFSVSVGTARKHLDHFARAGFLERLDEDHRYRVRETYAPVLESTISIEAKLHDWKRALIQAYRYRHFSNCSFVLLPTANASGALNNLELFRRHDVGLASLGTSGLYVHHYPEKRTRPMNAALLRVNEAVRNAYCC